jgi:hypothetical protein
MPDRATTQPTPEEHRPAGENPRNIPERRLGKTPPQPGAPEQSKLDEQQDQEPLEPGPLIREEIPAGQQREFKNG